MQSASETRGFRLVESGADHLRKTLPCVLRHLDSEAIGSITDSTLQSIESNGMRFAAAQAFGSLHGIGGPSNQATLSSDAMVPDSGVELASAYLLEYPGKFASLVGPWIDPGTDSCSKLEVGIEVLRTLVKCAQKWEMELVQAVIEEGSPFSTASLRAAGLSRLSILYQMAIDFHVPSGSKQNSGDEYEAKIESIMLGDRRLVWKRFSPRDLSAWVSWMDATYEQTADCPELNGLRTTTRTLEGYLAASGASQSGSVGPEWWAAFEDGDGPDPNLNRSKIITAFMLSSSGGGFWELSYMGVAPEHRGRGLGNETLKRAMSKAQSLRARRLSLAVDCRNSFAIRIYRAHGFDFLRQLEAWFLAFSK